MISNATGPSPSSSRQATAREFLAIVFRRKGIILGLFLVTTATVLVVALSTPLVYTSTGSVLVKRGEQETVLNPYRRVTAEWEVDLGSEIETVKSHPVMERATKLLEGRVSSNGKPIRLDPHAVGVEVRGKSNVVAISYEDGDADVAQKACEAVLQAYIDFRQSLMLTYPRAFFDSEIAGVEREIKHWSEQRRNFANRTGVVDIGEQRRVSLQTLHVLNTRLNDESANLAAARAELRIMRELQQNPAVDLPTVGHGYTNESALVDLKKKVVDQETRLVQLRERYREESPEIVTAQATLETLRDMLKREVSARLQVAQSNAEIYESRLQAVEKDVTRIRSDLSALPAQEVTMNEMDRELAILKTRYEELMENSDKAKITQNTSPAVSYLLLSPAGAPIPKNTRDYVRLALAPAFSLVVGIGLAFFIDGLDLTVRTASHAEDETELPVLASITERRRSG